MDDRNVQYPNRFQLTKVDGTDDIYEIVPAPGEVYIEGTFINKFALLKDTTAALFGLDVSNVPDDVLAFLGKYNQYWWKRRANSSHWEQVLGNPTWYTISYGGSSYTERSVSYFSDIDINSAGNVSLSTPVSTIQVSFDNYSRVATLRGKYFKGTGVGSHPEGTPAQQTDVNKLYYADESAPYTRLDQNNPYYVDMQAREVSSKWVDGAGDWEYVRSSTRNAYPDSGIHDGYEYQFLGIPFENSVLPLRVETGSYVGTGTYGVNNPCSLTLPFEPKLFIVGDTDGRKGTKGNYLYFALPIFLGDTYEKIDWKFGGSTATQYTLMKRERSTISWYINFTGSGSDQLNGTGTTYYYYAIG